MRPWFLLIPPLALACGDVGLTVFEPAEGPRPGGGVVVEGAVHQGSPALALDGDDTILVWAEPTPTGRDAHVRAARVRPSDEVVRGKSVLDRSVYDLRLWARPADWLLSWQEGSRASLLSLTRELDAFDRQSVPSGSSSSDLRAVRDGDAMYAVWTANVDNDYDVWGGRVGDDNVVRADTAGAHVRVRARDRAGGRS